MEKIVIRPEGAFYSFLDDESGSWIEKDLIESTLPLTWYFDMPVEISGRVSILKFLELFERYDEQLEFVFVKALKALALDDIFNVIDQVTEVEKSSLKATCLIRVGEAHYLDGMPDPVLVIRTALVGLDTEDLENLDDDSDEVYQLTNFDFVEWVKLPIYIDTYLDFAEPGKEEDEPIFCGEYIWTLRDVFETILTEISLNLFVSGLVSNPDIVIHDQSSKMDVAQFFKYLDDLGDISD